MSVCLRPVIEQWGESYTYDRNVAIVDLLVEIAQRADAGETAEHQYADKVVVCIEDGNKFLYFLSQGASAIKPHPDFEEWTKPWLAAADELAEMVPAWLASVDPDDGWLRIYVD